MVGRRIHLGRVLMILGLASMVSLVGAADKGRAIEELLLELRDDEFAVRQSAQKKLIEWGKEDLAGRIEFFWKQQNSTEDPEVRERCLVILKELVLLDLDRTRPGFMGIEMVQLPVPPVEVEGELVHGVTVSGVMPESSAEKFGIKPGDLILKIDEVDLSGARSSETLREYVGSKSSGTEIQVKLFRSGKVLELPLTLMKRPRGADLLRRRDPFNQRLGAAPSEEELRQRDFEKWLRRKEAVEGAEQ